MAQEPKDTKSIMSLSEAYKPVFEEGNVQTKTGVSVPAIHAFKVINALNALRENGKMNAISELFDAGENARISQDTIDALAGAASDILEGVSV